MDSKIKFICEVDANCNSLGYGSVNCKDITLIYKNNYCGKSMYICVDSITIYDSNEGWIPELPNNCIIKILNKINDLWESALEKDKQQQLEIKERDNKIALDIANYEHEKRLNAIKQLCGDDK
jgi:hypothetical protein